jgi:hypothetical protein
MSWILLALCQQAFEWHRGNSSSILVRRIVSGTHVTTAPTYTLSRGNEPVQ